MKKNMDKTTKNNLINYGIVIALFVIVQILSGTGQSVQTYHRSSGSAVRVHDCSNIIESGSWFLR